MVDYTGTVQLFTAVINCLHAMITIVRKVRWRPKGARGVRQRKRKGP
jgi:hypothetical protein